MKTSDSPTSLRSGYKYEEWAEQLRSRIERGELKPGDKLPSHAEMYAQHGLSRPVVEKVHSILEQDGLIERQPRRGAFVKAPTVSATDVIGFYCPSLRHYAGHPYYVRLLTAMSAEAHRVGLDLLLLNSDMAKQNWQKVGGVLLYKPDEILLEEQLDALPPSIARVSLLIGSPNATSVVADDYHGSKSATEHLLGLGHQRVAYLGLNEFRIMRERRNGFCDALRAANIAAGADSMRELNVEDVRSQGYMFAGRRAVENWLGDGWDGALTGIVAQNDDVAIGAIEALQSAGLRVPDDISVIGFDGTEIADYFRPRLTTMRVPLREIGARGVQLLQQQLNRTLDDQPMAPETTVLPISLVPGDSTAPPRSVI